VRLFTKIIPATRKCRVTPHTAAMAVEPVEDTGAQEEEEGHQQEASELPELLELIDLAETASQDVEKFVEVLRNIGQRIRATPSDRDLLSDFEGISQICQALKAEHAWRGKAMLAFCRIMPDVCRTSVVNRASLRDAGFLSASAEMLRDSLREKDEATATSVSTALCAMCTANDANKQIALLADPGDVEETQQGAEEEHVPGALRLLLDALKLFPASGQLQAEALAALRSLVVDDDSRKADCEPAAVQNREVLLSQEVYPEVKMIVQQACQLSQEQSHVKIAEQALLMLREIARGQERIQDLARPSCKLLSFVQKSLESSEPRILRGALGVLRAFALCEDVRDELSLSCETLRYAKAIRQHLATPVVCEQGFGLLANLTMRNPAMASFLNDSDHQIVSLGQQVIQKHVDRPDVAKSVIQLLWSVARQNPKAAAEVRELELFVAMRRMVSQHEGEQRWHGAVEASRQFLREFREDQGIQKQAVYNDYY